MLPPDIDVRHRPKFRYPNTNATITREYNYKKAQEIYNETAEIEEIARQIHRIKNGKSKLLLSARKNGKNSTKTDNGTEVLVPQKTHVGNVSKSMTKGTQTLVEDGTVENLKDLGKNDTDARDTKGSEGSETSDDTKEAAKRVITGGSEPNEGPKHPTDSNDSKVAKDSKIANDSKMANESNVMSNDSKRFIVSLQAEDSKITNDPKTANTSKIPNDSKASNDSKIANDSQIANDSKLIANESKITIDSKIANDSKKAKASIETNDSTNSDTDDVDNTDEPKDDNKSKITKAENISNDRDDDSKVTAEEMLTAKEVLRNGTGTPKRPLIIDGGKIIASHNDTSNDTTNPINQNTNKGNITNSKNSNVTANDFENINSTSTKVEAKDGGNAEDDQIDDEAEKEPQIKKVTKSTTVPKLAKLHSPRWHGENHNVDMYDGL